MVDSLNLSVAKSQRKNAAMELLVERLLSRQIGPCERCRQANPCIGLALSHPRSPKRARDFTHQVTLRASNPRVNRNECNAADSGGRMRSAHSLGEFLSQCG